MKMTKKKAAMFGLAAVTLFGTAGFGSCGVQEEVPDVYGPPVEFDVTDNEPVAVYGPPADLMDVKDNEAPEVYGPPVVFDDKDKDEEHDRVDSSPRDGKPRVEDNEPADVYGPPVE